MKGRTYCKPKRQTGSKARNSLSSDSLFFGFSHMNGSMATKNQKKHMSKRLKKFGQLRYWHYCSFWLTTFVCVPRTVCHSWSGQEEAFHETFCKGMPQSSAILVQGRDFSDMTPEVVFLHLDRGKRMDIKCWQWHSYAALHIFVQLLEPTCSTHANATQPLSVDMHVIWCDSFW